MRPLPPHRALAALVCALALLSAPRLAAVTDPTVLETANGTSALGWTQPTPTAQLTAVDTPLPDGMGAVFVPAMTEPEAEPRWYVRRDGETIGSAPVGQRVVVPPGDYDVLVGSDPLQTGHPRPVTVVAGETALVRPDWSALRVQVVDTNAVPFRGVYDLVRLPSLDNVGVGYGARIELGQRLQTWVLEPGLYMLLRRGESYQARENFFTVRLRPSHVERLVLVMDPDDGTFKGAGEIAALLDGGTEVEKDLSLSWVVGGGVALDVRKSVPGSPDTTELGPTFYTDFTLTWGGSPHFVYTRFKLDEEWTVEEWGFPEKDLDLMRLDALYAYELKPWIGPYVRVGLETSAFPSWLYFDEPTTVVDAADSTRTLHTGERFRIADAFSPLTVKAGGGLRFDAALPPIIEFWALAGLGGRQVFTSNVYAVADDPATPELEVAARGWTGDVGPEMTLFLELNPFRWLLVSTEFEVFAPLGALEDPTYRLESEVGLRVTSVVGLVYSLRIERQPAVTDDLQQTHSVVLRFSFTIF